MKDRYAVRDTAMRPFKMKHAETLWQVAKRIGQTPYAPKRMRYGEASRKRAKPLKHEDDRDYGRIGESENLFGQLVLGIPCKHL